MPIEALARRCRAATTPSRPFYQTRKANWAVHVNKHGKVLKCERLYTGKKPFKSIELPEVGRSSNALPWLFSDFAKNTLPPVHEDDEDKKQRKKRLSYTDAVRSCAESTLDIGAAAVLRLLEHIRDGGTKDQYKWPDEIKELETIVFFYDDAPVSDRPAVVQYWMAQQQARLDSDSAQCLACGNIGPIMRRISQQIKGVAKSLQGRAALVSCNNSSTFSSGHTGAGCSPLCNSCADAFTKSAQQLLDDPLHHLKLGPVDLLFWTEPNNPPVDAALHEALTRPMEKHASSAWYDAARQTGEAPQMHFLALSAQMRRIVPRLWLSLPWLDVGEALTTWYATMRGDNNEEVLLRPLAGYTDDEKIWHPGLLTCLTRSGKLAKVPAPFVTMVINAMLTQTPVPALVRQRALAASGGKITGAIVALTKLTQQEYIMVNMQAQRWGALFALLEYFQWLAIGQGKPVNRTIADRSLQRAAQYPKEMLGRLLIKAQAHLRKLERGRSTSRLRQQLEARLRELDLPDRFTLSEQADFAMAYYEATLARRNRRKEEEEDIEGDDDTNDDVKAAG